MSEKGPKKQDDPSQPPRKFDSERAMQLIRAMEPMYPYFSGEGTEEVESGLCSDCFYDLGLKFESLKFGSKTGAQCPNCRSSEGKHFSLKDIKVLAYRFYVLGTVVKSDYGAAPLVVFNEFQSTSGTLKEIIGPDAALFEKALGIGFFEYGPNAWMFGEITPLLGLQKKRQRPELLQTILSTYPEITLHPGDLFFRVRINPDDPTDILQYDSPPEHINSNGRFESKSNPILYGSPDLQTCIHECRTGVDDTIYAAALNPLKPLKFLDLTHIPEDKSSPTESIDLALHYIFRARSYSYEITRDLAKIAKTKGFDGVIFPSYFSALRTSAPSFETIWGMPVRQLEQSKERIRAQTIPNIGVFGRPISEDLIKVEYLNRVHLESASYSLRLGPLLTEKMELENSKRRVG